MSINSYGAHPSQPEVRVLPQSDLTSVSATFQATFTSAFQQQQTFIRTTLQRAINNAGSSCADQNWWKDLPQIKEAACAAQAEALTHIHVSKAYKVAFAGSRNSCLDAVCKALQVDAHAIEQFEDNTYDLLIAPHTLYGEIHAIFRASEELLRTNTFQSLQAHPFYHYFKHLGQNGQFVVTLNSGPNIHDFTHIFLDKHELHLEAANQSNELSFKIFNNAETFFRCLDIFKSYYEKMTGKTILCELFFSLPKIPLDLFCQGYVRHHPELATMSLQQRESYVRLLSVFTIGNDIVDCNITIKMSLQEKSQLPQRKRSFKPILDPRTFVRMDHEAKTNEISLGQLDLNQQIQNLSGSEVSMPYIKDADGQAQYEVVQQLFNRSSINMVDLGGGRGETNAVAQAIREAGVCIHLLNVEPHRDFATDYSNAHRAVGVEDVQVLQKKAQELVVDDVLERFHGEKVDLIFASHSLYFELGDMHKASLDATQPVFAHPLWKYFQMLREDGVFLITLQTGAGARLFRNALTGDHGLQPPSIAVEDETVSLLKSFGNMATALRHINVFQERFKIETGKTIAIKMHYAVANVPLGRFIVSQVGQTGGYVIHNPEGSDDDPNWLAPRMLDFYGNWNQLQKTATGSEDTPARTAARKTQSTFLHILRAFAPMQLHMQHPNITLELSINNK